MTVKTSINHQSAMSKAFELKGSLFTLTVLHLRTVDMSALEQQLRQTVQQAPKFFANTPVVIDVRQLPNQQQKELDLQPLKSLLRQYQFVLVALRGQGEDLRQQARDHHIAVFTNNTIGCHDEGNLTKKDYLTLDVDKHTNDDTLDHNESVSRDNETYPTRMITQPIRSGQQVYAAQSDLIVLAPVSHGAEVLADGNIHIYAPLRGRALAGVMGNTNARIFCKSLEAEIVSVAGRYLISEQLQGYHKNKMSHIFLQDDQLVIGTLED